MDFERFDKLARTDRVLLLTALELLWQNGRAAIQSEDVYHGLPEQSFFLLI